jgi:hypothetical protein
VTGGRDTAAIAGSGRGCSRGPYQRSTQRSLVEVIGELGAWNLSPVTPES